MSAFQTGDKVRLKSGGPLMTVDVPETQLGRVYCIWFEGNKKYDGEFSEETLEKADGGIGSATLQRR